MEFDFETLVERSGANLKLMMTPTEVVKAGNISLDGAEPDFKSAPVIEEAVIRFAKNGLYGFTLPDEAYKSAVTKWMQMSRKIQIKPEWIVTTLGKKNGKIYKNLHFGEKYERSKNIYRRCLLRESGKRWLGGNTRLWK